MGIVGNIKKELADQEAFNADADELFDTLFAEVETGRVSITQVGEFFPEEVVGQNSQAQPV